MLPAAQAQGVASADVRPDDRRGTLASGWQALRRGLTGPRGLLILACLAHVVVSLILVATPHVWWQQDEAVYISQVAAHTPALRFTAPRARGLPVLLYPFVHFTTGVTAIRTYVTVLGSLGLYLGLCPWLRLSNSRWVAGAAFVFCGLWATTFFGALVQPNMLVAVVAVGAVGYAVLALRIAAKRRYLIATGGWVALLALLRPSDATWLAVPLAVALLLAREQAFLRRLQVGAVVLVGLALGWSEWVIEAFTSYGGFFQRLRAANAENTPGLHFSLLAEARDINGPILCRPCTSGPVAVSHIAWWFALPLLAAIGLLAARGTKRFLPLALATLGGTALMLEYLLTISYSAPRFFLPAYALLAMPCAAGLAALFRWRAGTILNLAVVATVFGLLGAQFAIQANVVTRNVAETRVARDQFLTAAAALRSFGVRPPCVINGHHGQPVALALGCNDMPTGAAEIAELAKGVTVIRVTPGPQAYAYRGWLSVPLKAGGRWTAHVLRPPTATP
jgi:hypothetical protein